MLTIEALYEYKAKVEREMLMAEAKMTVICDLIAEESRCAMEEAIETAATEEDCFDESEDDDEVDGDKTESQNIY